VLTYADVCSQEIYLRRSCEQFDLLDLNKKNVCKKICLLKKKSKKNVFSQEIYLRRSCEQFDLLDLSNRAAHLTNICVQKHHHRFGEVSLIIFF
jgi:hypothetical protein